MEQMILNLGLQKESRQREKINGFSTMEALNLFHRFVSVGRRQRQYSLSSQAVMGVNRSMDSILDDLEGSSARRSSYPNFEVSK